MLIEDVGIKIGGVHVFDELMDFNSINRLQFFCNTEKG